MIITIDTEKDSKEDIKAIISMLQKEIGKEQPVEKQDRMGEQKTAEELLNAISKKGGESEIPKSVKEAYELTENLETY